MNNQKYLGLYIGNTIPNSAFNTSGNDFSLADIPIDYKPMCIKASKLSLQIQNITSFNYFNNFKMFVGQCYSDLDKETLLFYQKIIKNDGDEIKIKWMINNKEKCYTVEEIISTLVIYFYNNSFKKITSPETSRLTVVLTYPLYYNLYQKLSLHDILIDSQIELSYYIPEPAASIIDYINSEDYKRRSNEENLIVLHCGGRTTTLSEYKISVNEENGNTSLQLLYSNLLPYKKGLVYMIEEYIINYYKESCSDDINTSKRYQIHNSVIDYISILTKGNELDTVDDLTIGFKDVCDIITKYHRLIVELIPKDNISYIITTGTCSNPLLNQMLSNTLKTNCINIPILDEKTQKGTESIGAAIYGEKYGKYKIIPVIVYDIVVKLNNGNAYLVKKYTVLPFDSNEIIISLDGAIYKYNIDICAVGIDKNEVLIETIPINSSDLVRISISIDEKEKIILHISTSKDEIVLFPGFNPYY